MMTFGSRYSRESRLLGACLWMLLGGCASSAQEAAPGAGGAGAGGAPATTGVPGSVDEPSAAGGSEPAAAEGGADSSMPSGGGSAAGGGSGGEATQAGGSGGQAAGGTNAEGGDGGASMDELVLEGPPPQSQQFSSGNGQHFELLPDDDEFTNFQREGDRVQIIPVEDKNWPPDFDWQNAPGKDAELNEKIQWARARLTEQARSDLKTWYYDVTIDMCGESDGDSPFALALNGEIVAEVSAMPSGNNVCGRQEHTWEMIPIRSDDVIEIWGKPHSNLKEEEGAGPRNFSPTYAWARGRWHGVQFAPTPGVQ